MAGRHPQAVTLSAAQQAVLEGLVRQHSCPQTLALRLRIILGAAADQQNELLAARLGCTPKTVWKWRARWAAAERELAVAEAEPAALRQMVVSVLADAPRSGAPTTFSAEQVVQIINLACTAPRSLGRPIDAWTPRELANEAERQGIVERISPSSVGRFLGRGRAAAPSLALLAQRQDQSR